MSSNERRIILVGKTGNGKSSTGNTLLGIEAFSQKLCLHSVTQKCQMAENINPSTRCKVKVVDTPGLFDKDSTVTERALEIQRSVVMCPKPHAFLLVFNATGRLTDEEKFTTDVLRIIFGEEFFDYCIIVFTHGNEFANDEEFDTFMSSPVIADLKTLCNGRYIRVENRGNTKQKSSRGAIEMINQMSDNGRKTYIYEHMETHKLTLLEHQKTEDRNAQLETVLGSILESLSKRIKIIKPCLRGLAIGAKLVGATAIGGIYLGVKALGKK